MMELNTTNNYTVNEDDVMVIVGTQPFVTLPASTPKRRIAISAHMNDVTVCGGSVQVLVPLGTTKQFTCNGREWTPIGE